MENIQGSCSHGQVAGHSGQPAAPEPHPRAAGTAAVWVGQPQPANQWRTVSKPRAWIVRLGHCAAHTPITERG